MKKLHLPISCIALASMAAVGLVMKSGLANAQEAGDEQSAEVIEEIVAVESAIGRETEMITLRRQVTYADLDLSKHADVTELQNRIESIAKESCEKLEEMYPLPRDSSKSANVKQCTKEATASAADEIEAAIAAAQ